MKRKVASIILINKKKQILLHLRDDKPEIPYPNHWCLLGGHLDENETCMEALKREIKEEINYEVKMPILLGSVDDGVGNIAYVYKDKIDKETSELELTEGQKICFFDFQEIFKLKIPKPLSDFFIENKKKILS